LITLLVLLEKSMSLESKLIHKVVGVFFLAWGITLLIA